MHSCIFEISAVRDNLANSKGQPDYIDSSWFDDQQIGAIGADYLDDMGEDERAEAIESLKNETKSVFRWGVDESGACYFTPTQNAAVEWFYERFKQFTALAATTTIQDFCDSQKAFQLCCLITEELAPTYLYSEENGLKSLDAFIRSLSNYKTMPRFYVGGVVGYHV